MYAAVSARRTQFDNLPWQVSALSLTAQAFLFTLALSRDSTQLARTVACSLSMLSAFLTVHLMTRHRQAEPTDSHWIADWEKAAGVSGAHGKGWQSCREVESSDAWIFSFLEKLPGYRTWAVGLSLFGFSALLILIVTRTVPEWLFPPSCGLGAVR
jgi:hypothetical protein